ncbi:MAG: hypothetical protein HYW80_01150 [Parcubacteria group bacterium]|nr:hypothetical protein [Parcubacteria group bacterium]
MADNSKTEELKSFFEELLRRGGFSFENLVCREAEPGVFRCDVFSEDAGLLIGETGSCLAAWEQVLRARLAKVLSQPAHVIVDINNYRAQKDEELRELAKKSARQAALTKKPVALPIMNAYERKVVHLELALRPDVTTESEGEEPNRKVVVKPL